MKQILLTVFLSVMFLSASFSQRKLMREIVENRIHINTPDSSVVAFVLPREQNPVAEEEKIYYWFKSDKIRSTRGDYEGKLLDGTYTAFYSSQNLYRKGNFRKGLKTGIWKTWYPDGELMESVTWKNGLKHGHYRMFTASNRLVEKGRFRNGKLKGTPRRYDEDGVDITRREKRLKRKQWRKSLFKKKSDTKPEKEIRQKKVRVKKEKTGKSPDKIKFRKKKKEPETKTP